VDLISLQPSARTDHITEDGAEFQQLPYPFHVNERGDVQRQDFWRGRPLRVIGFTTRVDLQEVVLWWEEVWAAPELAVGRYVVTEDTDGQMSTHILAIETAARHG